MRNSLLAKLNLYQDDHYKIFQSSLIPDVSMLGIRIPIIEKLCKQYTNQQKMEFLNQYTKESIYELQLVYCIFLRDVPLTYQDKIGYLDKILEDTNNWALCDALVSRCKWIRDDLSSFQSQLEYYFLKEKFFYQRFVYVTLLQYYLQKENLPYIYSFCEKPFIRSYYVQMSIAWLLSITFIRFPKDTNDYLEKCTLDDFTKRKTIQKIKESKQLQLIHITLLNKMKTPSKLK